MAGHAANVESERDPRTPGRTAYRITGQSRASVQAEIDRLMAAIDDQPGFADFVGPAPVREGWGALGHVTVAGAA